MKYRFLALLVFAAVPGKAAGQLSCALNVPPIQFGNVGALEVGTYDARGMIEISCSGSQGAVIAACIDIGQGAAAGSSGGRVVSAQGGRSTLPVQIYQDSALPAPWDSMALTQWPQLRRTGDGAMSAPVYLRVQLPLGAASAPYTASFPVTIRYGAVTGAALPACTALSNTAAGTLAPKPAPLPAKKK